MNRRHHLPAVAASLVAILLAGWLAVGFAQEEPAQPVAEPEQPAFDLDALDTPVDLEEPDLDTPPGEQPPEVPLDEPLDEPLEPQQQPQRPPQQQPQQPQPFAPEQPEALSHDQIMQECLRLCRECAQICNRTSWYAYRQGRGGGVEMLRVQQLTGDCQAFCELAARMMERHSPLMAESCGACEAACRACMEACEQAVEAAGGQHQLVAQCADICRRCAESCRQMVEAMADGDHEHHEHQHDAQQG